MDTKELTLQLICINNLQNITMSSSKDYEFERNEDILTFKGEYTISPNIEQSVHSINRRPFYKIVITYGYNMAMEFDIVKVKRFNLTKNKNGKYKVYLVIQGNISSIVDIKY